jgi:hypothetical protein
MRATRIVAVLCLGAFALSFMAGETRGDVIRLKKGGAQKCVIVKETEESVCYQNSMGTVTMRTEKIASIERESDETNSALKNKWNKKKSRRPSAKPKAVAVKPKKPKKKQPNRTYKFEVTIRRIMLGGRDSAMAGGELVAEFVIGDLGEVKGNRLFEIKITSHKNGTHRVRGPSFRAYLHNGLRIDPMPLDGYPELDDNLKMFELGSGYVAFPVAGKLEKLVFRSSLTDFDLDLESGALTVKRGPF